MALHRGESRAESVVQGVISLAKGIALSWGRC